MRIERKKDYSFNVTGTWDPSPVVSDPDPPI